MARNRFKETTTTFLVMEALKAKPNDFTSTRQLVELTHRTSSQVSAALHHLRLHLAVDVVIEVDGTGWWFATPDQDNRHHVNEEYKLHTKVRKRIVKS